VNWEGLKECGESCDDLMINLFKGYQNASNHEFVRYIKQKRDNYDDGADMQPKTLMMLALNKYKMISKMDLWNTKTQEQEIIIALTAELGKIKDDNFWLPRSLDQVKSHRKVQVTRIIEKYPQLAKWETQKEMMEKFTKMEGQNGRSVPTQPVNPLSCTNVLQYLLAEV
jgi:hypothetical protein